MGDAKDALAYSLSNDFPSIKCRLSDDSLAPENTVPLFIDFDYDMVLTGGTLKTTQIVRKVEDVIVEELIGGLFNCTVVEDEEERRKLADQRAMQEDKISVVGVDARPNDIIDTSAVCAPDTMEEYEGDCYALNGGMAIALTTDGVKKSEEIKYNILADIQSGMTYDEYLRASDKLVKLEFVGDRSDPNYGQDWPTSTPSTTPSVTPSAAPSEKDVNFVAILPGDTNVVGTGTDAGNDGGDDDGGALGFVEIGAMIIGFLVLLILLILLIHRKDRRRKDDEEDNDVAALAVEGDDGFDDINLQEVTIAGGEDLEGGSSSAVDGHTNLAICGIASSRKNQDNVEGNNGNDALGHSPRYGDASFGAIHSVHDVHNCRSQTCEACARAGTKFVPVTPSRFYIQ